VTRVWRAVQKVDEEIPDVVIPNEGADGDIPDPEPVEAAAAAPA
jgi:hypothetical protein